MRSQVGCRFTRATAALIALAGLWSSATAQDFQFAKRLGGSLSDQVHGLAVFSNGDFAAAGSGSGSMTFGQGEANETTLSLGSGTGPWVARFAADGSLQWAKTFPHTNTCWVTRSCALSDGSVLITGSFYGSITFGADEAVPTKLTSIMNNDLFVARFASDGSLVFAHQASGSRIAPIGMDVFDDGSFVITGTYNGGATVGSFSLPPHGDWDMFTAGFDANGNVRWARAAGGLLNDGGWNVTCLPDGTAVVAAYLSGGCVIGEGEPNEKTLTVYSSPDLVLCKYDSNGVLGWIQQFQGTTAAGWVGIDNFPDGSIVVSGEFDGGFSVGSFNVSGNGNLDAFLARFAPNGSPVWVKTVGSSGIDRGHGVATTSSGDIVWCGEFSGAPSFGVGQSLTSAGGTDVFLAHYTGNGAFVWAQRAGGAQNDSAQEIEVLDGNVLVSGTYQFSATFGAGQPTETNLAAAGSDDVFVAHWFDPTIAAIPPSLAVPANVTQECVEPSLVADVEFSVEVDGTLPSGTQLVVRDVTANRLLLSQTATVGVINVGPNAFPMGVSTVEVSLVDGSEILVAKSFDVMVEDTTAPVLSGCEPKTLELEGPLTALTVSRLGITAFDDCDTAPVITLSPTQVPLGSTQVTATATDATGNSSQCTFMVMIVDTTSPTFDVTQADIERIATSDGVVVGFDVVASDLSGDVMVFYTDEDGRTVLPSGSLYLPGTHTVTCTAIDGSGNSAVDTFVIQVLLDQDPMVQVPDDIVVGNDAGEAFAHVSWTIVVTDDLPGVTVETTAGGGPVQSGDAFPIGATTVTCVATDSAGQTATASFQIIVQDREAPAVTLAGSTDLWTDTDTVTLTAQLLDLQVADNYDPNPVVVFTPSTVGLGTTSVTCTVTDMDGNATVIGFQVNVYKSTLNVGAGKTGSSYTKISVGGTIKVRLKLRDGHTRVNNATVELIEVARVDQNGTVIGVENVASDSLTTKVHHGDYTLQFDTSGWTNVSGTLFKVSVLVTTPDYGPNVVELFFEAK